MPDPPSAPRGIEGLVDEVADGLFGPRRATPGAAAQDCDTCRYTGTGLCSAAGGYLLVQRSRQTNHRGFLLGVSGGCFALALARWVA